MAKNSIVDKVAEAVVRAELAVVKTGREAVQAVNRKIGAGKRKVASKKKAAKKAARKAVSRTKRAVRKVARKATRKATKKAARRGRRR
ncbi:hypothetical protein SAMN02990966_01479 [Rhodospirillales bacterium URHD0017]|nr:hypothetical protein SAMN02990966_01479 [Rhodospirillales bacterium URHD0017]